MQAYGRNFSKVYNARWGGFDRQVGPLISEYYASTPSGQQHKPVLDLCCGPGHLSLHFLEKGYRVVGIDLSEPMLEFARENTRLYVDSGKAEFIQGDASHFTLDERFGLVVSTFDALNHLENIQALKECFQCARAVCDGTFIFDLNTRSGLNRWNSINVDESDAEIVIINRGIYDGKGDKAWARITGFTRVQEGLFERFEETVFNTVFDMEEVKQALLDAGWKHVHFARVQDLKTPIEEPEKEGRVFFVASSYD